MQEPGRKPISNKRKAILGLENFYANKKDVLELAEF